MKVKLSNDPKNKLRVLITYLLGEKDAKNFLEQAKVKDYINLGKHIRATVDGQEEKIRECRNLLLYTVPKVYIQDRQEFSDSINELFSSEGVNSELIQ